MDYKQEYIKMRNAKQYNLQFFYNYYLHKGGMVTDPEQFTDYMLYQHVQQPTPPGYPPITMRVGEIDKNMVINHLDSVFGLTVIEDKDGNFLKVVE